MQLQPTHWLSIAWYCCNYTAVLHVLQPRPSSCCCACICMLSAERCAAAYTAFWPMANTESHEAAAPKLSVAAGAWLSIGATAVGAGLEKTCWKREKQSSAYDAFSSSPVNVNDGTSCAALLCCSCGRAVAVEQCCARRDPSHPGLTTQNLEERL